MSHSWARDSGAALFAFPTSRCPHHAESLSLGSPGSGEEGGLEKAGEGGH